jgi:hypothetical protein
MPLRVDTGDELAGRLLDLEGLEDGAGEVDVVGLAGDVVEVVAQVDAEAGAVDGALGQAAGFAGLVEEGEQLLVTAEGEDGDED